MVFKQAHLAYFGPGQGAANGSFRLIGPDNNDKEFGIFLKEISDESERGVAILCAAILDELLREMLQSYFQNSEEVSSLFDPMNALGTFGTRVEVCFGVGLISEQERKNLKQIQRIRNEFAHIRAASFDRQDISDRCRNLDYAELGKVGAADLSNRDKFLANCLNLAWEFFGRPEEIQSKAPKLAVSRKVKFLDLKSRHLDED